MIKEINVSSTVLIVDDNAGIRRTFRSCIEHEGEMTVCGEAENGAMAVEQVLALRPDVVILNLQMPVMNGLEAAPAIAAAAPQTAMLMLTLQPARHFRAKRGRLAFGKYSRKPMPFRSSLWRR